MNDIMDVVQLVLHNLWGLVKAFLLFAPFAAIFLLPWILKLKNKLIKWLCWLVGGVGGLITGLILIVAALANIWTFICLVIMAVVVVLVVGSVFGVTMGALGAGSRSKKEKTTVWRDAAGGIHTNGVDAREANKRMGKNPNEISMTSK